ncbi:NUDIX hydrolase [Lysinibacillus fusiformis]|uniref:NUDIX hydrolase n=1 Tax=Lysinibacillus fusiformis TaxID=28031 RepID=UPI001882B97D|nr:NUDIX domain-containing protein [Lysinibacillus fusiformis]MBD8521058.1 NUDIX domain-containing protein [Lysinibacillus fusiformis]
MTTTYVNWGESKVKLTWEKNTLLPPYHLITSVHGFCFQEDQLLLVDVNHRGWDFPGGHIETGESPEDCFKREAREEGYVEGECKLLGHIIVDHSENPLWTESSFYPKMGFQIFYKMTITNLLPFEGEFESAQRMFVNPNDIASYYHKWNILYKEIVDCAIQ